MAYNFDPNEEHHLTGQVSEVNAALAEDGPLGATP